jgi:hypothetical protein
VTADIESVEWSHPSAPAPFPHSITYVTAGWVVHDRAERPMQYEGAVRVEVGSRYLMPIAVNSRGVLAPIASSAVVQVEGNKVAIAGEAAAETSPAETALDGHTVTDVGSQLATANADPLAEANRDLNPVERAQAVAAAR